MKKKLLSLLLILCLTALPIAGASAAYAPEYTVYADTLFGLGLFQGDGIAPDGTPSYRLGDGMTRAECIVMLLRLLGEEDAALAADRAAPFRDMTGHWAIRYVSYAYEKGYTSGTGADTFSPDDKASAKMYLTFLLRALGYNDKAGDFTYAAAYEKAAELGVCPKGAYATDAAFYRDDCVYTSYLALRTPQKGSSETLLDALEAKSAVDADKAALARVIGDPGKAADGLLDLFVLYYVGNSYSQIRNLFPNGYYREDTGYVTSSLVGVRFGQIAFRFDDGADRPSTGAAAPLRQFMTDKQRAFTPEELAKAIGGEVLSDRIEAKYGECTLSIYPENGAYTTESMVVYAGLSFVPLQPEDAVLNGEWLGELDNNMVTVRIKDHSGSGFTAELMESVQTNGTRGMSFENVTFTSADGVHYSSAVVEDWDGNCFEFTLTADTVSHTYTVLTLTSRTVSLSPYTPPNYAFPDKIDLTLFA